MKIVLGAVISLTPFSAGMAWNWLQLAAGLRRLGHDLHYVEEVDPSWCVDASGRPSTYARSIHRTMFEQLMKRVGLEDRACQVYDGGARTTGLTLDRLKEVFREADLLINMAGHIRSEELLEHAPKRVYVDQDPVYTQLWRHEYGEDLNFDRHDVFFSVGWNIGTEHTHIPDGGVEWKHLSPTIILEDWPSVVPPEDGSFTTVASWTSYGDICFRGEWYLSKSGEFKKLVALPSLTSQPFEVALRRHEGDDAGIRQLRSAGWDVTPAERLDSMERYQSFIHRSRAEIGIAKHAYVKGRSAWFSDRSVHYLASGRPVLAQSTGFERVLPTGQGLLSYRDVDDAAMGVEQINADYAQHCTAARELAAEYFDYRRVLPAMLRQCDV